MKSKKHRAADAALVQRIRRMYRPRVKGRHQVALAEKFAVSQFVIFKVINRIAPYHKRGNRGDRP